MLAAGGDVLQTRGFVHHVLLSDGSGRKVLAHTFVEIFGFADIQALTSRRQKNVDARVMGDMREIR